MDKCDASFSFRPIAYAQSCFKQKFGIPRQPGLIKQAKGKLVLLPEYSQPDSIRGLENYSHIWLLFVFHQSYQKKFKSTVRPPRLGGNERMGVFATRSNFRPNPIGQSVVKLEDIDIGKRQIILHISGIDLLDNTPILDIKPYIPYADIVSDYRIEFAANKPEKLFDVEFSILATKVLEKRPNIDGVNLKEFIIDLLSYDPRPAYADSQKMDEEKTIWLFNLGSGHKMVD